jgi:hypothetical protein
MTVTREEFALQMDTAEWSWLRAHLERGGVIIVAPELSLPEAAERIAADDQFVVQEWIAADLLRKPSRDEVATWDRSPTRRFMTLIVSPYVLIQDQPQ